MAWAGDQNPIVDQNRSFLPMNAPPTVVAPREDAKDGAIGQSLRPRDNEGMTKIGGAMEESDDSHVVHVFSWTEHERGWGQRPDGFSIHASAQAAKDYVADFYKRARVHGRVPDEYEQPDSDEPIAVRTEKLIAQWVEREDRRMWRGAMKIESGRLVFADPKIRARVEHEMIEACAQPCEVSKGPRL